LRLYLPPFIARSKLLFQIVPSSPTQNKHIRPFYLLQRISRANCYL